jgi:hypothetical protein
VDPDERDDKPDPVPELGFPTAGEALETPSDADAEDAEAERELTAMEMMGAPNRPSDSARKTVLWLSLAFAMLLFALTVGVMTIYGLDVLTLFTVAILGFVIAAMVGALRYKGEDPMAQFDPPERPKRHFWRRKK